MVLKDFFCVSIALLVQYLHIFEYCSKLTLYKETKFLETETLDM